MNPKYPIYVISKGRWESRLTVKALIARNTPYHIVIEPQEYKMYASVIDKSHILTLPFSNLGEGSIPARNWVFEHSKENGHARHWILDDNIREFFRLTNNMKYRTNSGATFRACEDFVDRYTNVALAGMQYAKFASRRHKYPPFILNTRIYSCILINNNIRYRWRGRYNEDTDLSIRVLKDDWCTVLFYAFLADKVTTMTMKGGNTKELYKQDDETDGRLLMAQSLQRQHPDVAKVVWRYNRWQHEVNYKPFKENKLIRKKGVVIPKQGNEYNMKLIKRGDNNALK
jgi:hypothetical protein